MYKIFGLCETCNIIIPQDAEKSIFLAANNLRENLLQLSGKETGFEIVSSGHGIEVLVNSNTAPQYDEGYRVDVTENGIIIAGYDTLGTIFGIFAFATQCLKIDPMYRFTDVFPESVNELVLDNISFTSSKKHVRYRGWFINDEDFLSGYKIHSCKRRIYHNQDFFKNIISSEMIDIICETALRLENNLLIPCSYLDILNPPEEEIVKTVVSRGMYISTHHQEPVGVGHFAAANYFEENYTGKSVSLFENPTEMESVWRIYVKKWAKYKKNVIWQLGLRGQNDTAVWNTDKSISSDDSIRGEIISKAIEKQHNIIKEYTGSDDFISTMTLWMEAAGLYEQGYLRIPPNTITVFGDLGLNQLMCSDFYNVTRNENSLYGIYYHAALHIEGPHFTDGTHPEKMLFCYQEAEKYNSLHLSVLNVGNLREVCPTVRLNAAILKGKPSEFSFEDYHKKTFTDLFGDVWHEVAQLDREYFNSIGDLGKKMLREFCEYSDFSYHEYENLPYPYFPLTDGCILRLGATFIGKWRNPASRVFTHDDENFEKIQKIFLETIENYTSLLPKLSKLQEKIPKKSLSHYRFSRIYRTRFMLNATKWAYYASLMFKDVNNYENRLNAVHALNNILSFRNEFTEGKWNGWYDNDLRHGLPGRLESTWQYMGEE